jgi:predicted ArsR family transcriptional regulator
VLVTLNEKNRRRFAGLLALEHGRGGIQAMAAITGLSRNTIRRGCEEVRRTDRLPTVRQAGAGRPAIEKNARRS